MGGSGASLTVLTHTLNQKLDVVSELRRLALPAIELLPQNQRVAAQGSAEKLAYEMVDRASQEDPALPVYFGAESLLSMNEPHEYRLVFEPRGHFDVAISK